MQIGGKRVKCVVTGAAGFIGARLVEVLAEAHGVSVVAVVRDYANVARIARLNVPVIKADLLQFGAINQAIEGADVVFHCAYGGAATPQAERDLNFNGTLALAQAANRHKVRRFINVSTMAVYGHDLPPTVTEVTPCHPTSNYGRVKLEIEQALNGLSSTSGLDVRTMRPTKVYGPYDFRFTVATVRKLLNRRLWLIENGSGVVSPGYVDNLVHGLLLCAQKDGIKQGTYIVADGQSLTWAELYRHFARMTGQEPCGTVTMEKCAAAAREAARRPSPLALLRATLLGSEARALYPKFSLYRLLRGRISQELVERAKGPCSAGLPTAASSQQTLPPLPSLQECRDYVRRGAFSTALAQRELGFRPVLDIDAAMARTEAWLRFAEILPQN